MDREPSLLRNGHRELLTGEREIERPSDERSMRSTMRERIRNGLMDFTLLLENLSRDEREKIFRGITDSTTGEKDEQQFSGERELSDGNVEPALPDRFFSPTEDILIRTNSDLERGMIDAIAFLYISAKSAGLEPHNLIESAVARAEERLNDGAWLINSVSLEVDKDVQHTLAKRGLANIAAGGELTNAQVRALLESGRGNITPEEIQKYIRGVWEPEDSRELDPASGV